MENGDEDRLGRRAVAKGWLAASSLEAALAELESARGRGERVSLGSVLVRTGRLTKEQVRTILAEQRKEILVCSDPGCGRRYNVERHDPSRTYRCKACGARLAATAPEGPTLLDVDDRTGPDTVGLPDIPPPARELETAPTIAEGPGGTVLAGAAGEVGRTVAIRLAGSPRPEVGTPLGRYAGAVEIARGGMGAVYRAVDPDLGRPVAIKVILSGASAGREGLARFLREAQITGQLQHPNIPPIFELARTDGGDVYFAMKLIEGRSLADVLGELVREGTGALVRERRRLLEALVKVCDALAYAHSRGVVHRDLKPANVMVGAFGEVLVMDWGIAKVLGASDVEVPEESSIGASEVDPLRTLEGAVMGTPAYMSPEQASGQVDAIDPRSDVYSLGAMLFEVLTGTAPFRGTSLEKILTAIVQGRLEAPSRRAPVAEIPPELDRLVTKAIHKVPTRRYRSVADLRADLAAYLADRPIAAFRYTAWQRARKWLRRNRAVSSVAFGSLAVLLVFLAVLVRSLAKEGEARAEATRRAEREGEERRRAEEARRQADAAMEDVLRLSEATIAGSLLDPDRVAGAWVGFPSDPSGLEAWRAEAARVLVHRAYHEAKLEEIRARGRPSAGDRVFEVASDRWLHDNRRSLVERFADLAAVLSDVEAGLERAGRLRRELDRAAWEEARAEGLSIEPVPGLVPIGRDPDSGLWELWHVESGERPVRSGGRVQPDRLTGVVLVLVPGGRFRQGSDSSRYEIERPAHDVDLPPFLIAKFEMTRAQWLRLTGEEPGFFKGDPRRPVEQVSWVDCRRNLPRFGLRLPTESEWEYAARGGTTGPWWTPEEDLRSAGNVADQAGVRAGLPEGEPWDDGHGAPAPVGSYRPNPFGLHDTIGNVWEWCQDAYDEGYDGAPRDGSAREGRPGDRRVTRGSSFAHRADEGRPSFRSHDGEDNRVNTLGVRPAASIRVR